MVTSITTSVITTFLTIGSLFYFVTKDDIIAEENREVLNKNKILKKLRDFRTYFPQYECTVEKNYQQGVVPDIVTVTNPKETPIDMQALKDYFGMTNEGNSQVIGDFLIQIAKY